jgi:hypothetical protein
VHYRYDEDQRQRLKTVELVVERCAGQARSERHGSRQLGDQGAGGSSRTVALRIGWRESDLQRRLKSAGGRWYPGRKVWMLRCDVVERLGPLDRVVGGGA